MIIAFYDVIVAFYVYEHVIQVSSILHFLAGLVSNAAGLAVLTVAKVGFLVTARGGSGIVIAKLEDDSKYQFIKA